MKFQSLSTTFHSLMIRVSLPLCTPSSDSPSGLHYQVVYRENTSSTVGKLADLVYKLAVFDLNDVVKPERKLVFPAVLPNTILNNTNTQYDTNEPSAGTVSMSIYYVYMYYVRQGL